MGEQVSREEAEAMWAKIDQSRAFTLRTAFVLENPLLVGEFLKGMDVKEVSCHEGKDVFVSYVVSHPDFGPSWEGGMPKWYMVVREDYNNGPKLAWGPTRLEYERQKRGIKNG